MGLGRSRAYFFKPQKVLLCQLKAFKQILKNHNKKTKQTYKDFKPPDLVLFCLLILLEKSRFFFSIQAKMDAVRNRVCFESPEKVLV